MKCKLCKKLYINRAELLSEFCPECNEEIDIKLLELDHRLILKSTLEDIKNNDKYNKFIEFGFSFRHPFFCSLIDFKLLEFRPRYCSLLLFLRIIGIDIMAIKAWHEEYYLRIELSLLGAYIMFNIRRDRERDKNE